jgi:multidrug transporter EmrE-like cation transporter
MIVKILLLEINYFVLSLSWVFEKIASNYTFWTPVFLGAMMLALGTLAVYALIWQQVLKRISLVTAYSNRGITYLWLLLLSVLVFKESITVFNIIGVLVIITGIYMVSANG